MPGKSGRQRPVLFRHRFEYLGFLMLRALLRALPFRVASNLSSKLWQWIAPKLHRHVRAQKHLQIAYPEKSAADREAILHAMWGHLGRTMAESFVIDRIANNSAMLEYDFAPGVKSLLDQKRPLIVVGLHLGNWELPAVGAAQYGVELAGLYQRILNPLVDRAVTGSRSPYYPAGLYTKGHETVKTLMRLVRQGKSVGIISDLRSNRRGLRVKFFGRAAKSSPFPAMLSVMYDAPIVAAQCVRLAPDRFRIEAVEIKAPDGSTRDETIFNRTAAIQAMFEVWIRQHPEQWMWAHRRWD